MPRSCTRLAVAAALAVLVAPAIAAQKEQKEKSRSAASREDLEAAEATLARAVDRVSLPHAAPLLGQPGSSRAYRLPGYGIVLVLTPRTLPGGEGQIYVFHGPKHRRARTVVAGPSTAEPSPPDEEAIETFERQVLVLQHETEAQRRAAEEQAERMLEDIRVRTESEPEVHVEVPVPPPAPPEPATPQTAPAPPPWKFWFQTDAATETRTPDAVIAAVRGALVDALASGIRASGLAGDERVAVTVDFVPGGIFAASPRPEKTLVVSARARDLEARARGAMTPDELKKRIEVTEY
jgi:hypothetical protein